MPSACVFFPSAGWTLSVLIYLFFSADDQGQFSSISTYTKYPVLCLTVSPLVLPLVLPLALSLALPLALSLALPLALSLALPLVLLLVLPLVTAYIALV